MTKTDGRTLKCWMAIFNPETWADFVEMRDRCCGFADNSNRRFPSISVSDRFICYVAKAQTWTGVLAVTGDRTRVTEGKYPNRYSVASEVVIADPKFGVPMSVMEGKLSFFPQGGTAKEWAPHVRISPRIMHIPDAEALAVAIKSAYERL